MKNNPVAKHNYNRPKVFKDKKKEFKKNPPKKVDFCVYVVYIYCCY